MKEKVLCTLANMHNKRKSKKTVISRFIFNIPFIFSPSFVSFGH